jgi:transposase-like protein
MRKIREQLRLSVSEVAHRLGVNQSTVTRWEAWKDAEASAGGSEPPEIIKHVYTNAEARRHFLQLGALRGIEL